MRSIHKCVLSPFGCTALVPSTFGFHHFGNLKGREATEEIAEFWWRRPQLTTARDGYKYQASV